MISWKYSFKQLNEEYDLANRKKQALDKLYETGKISQATRDSFDNEIKSAIIEIEKKQKELLVNMQVKTTELLDKIATLEKLLANFEVQYVVGEIEDGAYQQEIALMSASLDSAKNELGSIKQAMDQLSPENVDVASVPEHVDAPQFIDVQPVDVACESFSSESVPILSATTETTQEVAPVESTMVNEASTENSSIQTGPDVQVIIEPQEFEITEPAIPEPVINMAATTTEQQEITVAPVIFEAMPEAAPIEQAPIIESAVTAEVKETLKVETLSPDSSQ